MNPFFFSLMHLLFDRPDSAELHNYRRTEYFGNTGN